MPLEIVFEEDYKSRPVAITQDSFDQNFTFYMCGNFLDEADVDPTYGPDDDIKALEQAYLYIPPSRSMPLYDGSSIILTLINMSVTRMQADVWKIEVQYGVPNTGGSSGGGYSQDPGDIGPNVGDYQKWSNQFIQLNFSVSSEMVQRKLSRKVVACQRAFGSPAGSVPYTQGQPGPMGLTIDGVEGGDFYARQFDFGITAYLTPFQLSFAYVRRLYRMATTLNNKVFFGFPPGSVIFLEADASGDVFSIVPVNYTFKMRPNFKFSRQNATQLVNPEQDDPTLMYDSYYEPEFPDADNSGIAGAGNAFSGWDDVDYLFKQVPNTGMTAQKPSLRTIHRKYEFADFDKLEL